ncbi:cytochrome d ubiquinol oxidase subunit II [Actinomadura macrotermitis]|uniref:Cytochrome d ubiquinol oxidase subunit II n=1 Tax=Actinomadura macrotermitis TaxID=2585200 RepID=A0A7K0C877_9ACTN|nr:cytochrome d ubiquinol oxidase subunit II [Actinomadura macrotermitis]MQY09667.1 hypothetical protein [Actinomadura macrotermitis]
MLAELPIVFVLIGIAAYTVLAGADFGAGVWTLLPGGGKAGAAATRAHAHHAMGPVWEANHVWLIFVLVVTWTAYPVAFASITSTLVIPLFAAAVGIILRGTAYALRGTLDAAPGSRPVDDVFALSSVLTPFAMGAVAGGIASRRVPTGNAAGDLVTSWLNPTSILVGVLAVAVSAYLAAVYLAADARRLGEQDLEHDFRTRALVTGVVTGAIAIAGLFVARADARPLWDGLTGGAGLVMAVVSAAAGLATFLLVGRNRFDEARASAALAVAALVAGWAAAQRPYFLRDLTVKQAAAGRETLAAVVISVLAGAVILLPSLFLLFRLFLRGQLAGDGPEGPDVPAAPVEHRSKALGAFTVVCLVLGLVLTVVVGDGWALLAGVVLLCATAVSGSLLAVVSAEESGG